MKNAIQFIAIFFISLLFIQCTDETDLPEPLEETETEAETVMDIDGNVYETIRIGNQTWMVENLKTITFNDGTPISEWEFGESWHNLNNPQFFYQWASTGDLNNLHDEELPEDFYGALYNDLVLSSGKLAPEGWRIPSSQDFRDLEAFLASDGHTGKEALAIKSTFGWVSDLDNGTDDYGFSALPNGYVAAGGTATGAQVIATLATSDLNTTDKTRMVLNIYQDPTFSFANNSWHLGAGVRCIKE